MSYFEALGLTSKATPEDARAAYVRMAQTMHPDKGGNPVKWTLITAAYNAIKAGRTWDRSLSRWQAEWDALNGKRAESSSRPSDSDIDWLIYEYQQRMRRQREAEENARRTAQAERERARRMWEQAQRRHEDEAARRQRAYAEDQKANAWRVGKCGAETKSGPCCRPAGHTPNGHMSQQVADQKRANAKARQGK